MKPDRPPLSFSSSSPPSSPIMTTRTAPSSPPDISLDIFRTGSIPSSAAYRPSPSLSKIKRALASLTEPADLSSTFPDHQYRLSISDADSYDEDFDYDVRRPSESMKKKKTSTKTTTNSKKSSIPASPAVSNHVRVVGELGSSTAPSKSNDHVVTSCHHFVMPSKASIYSAPSEKSSSSKSTRSDYSSLKPIANHSSKSNHSAPARSEPKSGLARNHVISDANFIGVDNLLHVKVDGALLGRKISPQWRKECRQIFDMFDKNGDNVINVEELSGILEILGYSPTVDEVRTILERFDQDNSGTIDFDEYLILIQHWIEQDEEQIYEAFKVFDKDGDGFVSAQELKRALTQYGEQFTEDEANEFFNMMDTDGDGVINYEEFVEYLRSMQKYSADQ